MSALLSRQMTKHKGTIVYCPRCLTPFQKKTNDNENKKLKEHLKFCKEQNLQRIRYPKAKEQCVEKFKSHHKRVRNLFVGYCDFEALLKRNESMKNVDTRTGRVEDENEEPPPTPAHVRGYTDEIDAAEQIPDYRSVRGWCDGEDEADDDPPPPSYRDVRGWEWGNNLPRSENDNIKKEQEFAEHVPVSFGAKIVSEDGLHDYPLKIYKGDEPALVCLDYFIAKAAEIKKKYIEPDVPHGWDEEKATAYKLLHKNCFLCAKLFEDGEKKILEHNHLTGKVRGVACNACNLKYRVRKKSWKLPVLLHNMARYDSKFLINAVRRRHGYVNITASNMESFISFTVGDVSFIDSCLFLPDSLENLAKDVLRDETDWNYVYEATGGDKRLDKFIKKKLPFPYTFFDDKKKLKLKKLPSIEDFYDTLKDEPCDPEKYEIVKALWDILGSFEKLHDLYLSLDTLLLCDIGEKFRNESIKNFSLDPTHYHSLPGYSWDAMLFYTGAELELLSDEDKYTFFEKSIRGGICQASKRYASANNSYQKTFDSSLPEKYLVQLDANNLYALSLRDYLPQKNFKWVPEEELDEICDQKFIENLKTDSDIGQHFQNPHEKIP